MGRKWWEITNPKKTPVITRLDHEATRSARLWVNSWQPWFFWNFANCCREGRWPLLFPTKIIEKNSVDCSMQGIISNILQRMKSASHSTISAPAYDGDGTLVILARVFHGAEIFVILSRVYQARDTSHLGTGVSWRTVVRRHCQMPAIPPSYCSPITYIFRRIWTSHFLTFSGHSSIISFPTRRPWLADCTNAWVGLLGCIKQALGLRFLPPHRMPIR